MVLTRFALIAFLATAVSSCSAVQSLTAKKDENKDAGATKEVASDPAKAECAAGAACDTATDQPLDEEAQFGLASYCTYEKNDKGEGCFTCTPRDLPDTRCTAIPADFDPAKACQHDFDAMTCQLADGKEYIYDFNEESKDEKLYNKIPLLLIGAKALLADKLKDKPDVRDLVYGAIDIVDNYKKLIFTNGDLGPMIDELAAVVKKAKPEYEQAKIDEFKAQAKVTIKAMQDKRAAGKLDVPAMLSTFNDILGQLPQDLVGPILENFDLSKIMAALSGTDDAAIQDLLAYLGGGKSIDELISGLETPDEAATGTGTGSGSGSGSGT